MLTLRLLPLSAASGALGGGDFSKHALMLLSCRQHPSVLDVPHKGMHALHALVQQQALADSRREQS
jgi:hypothetical protein